MIIDIYPQKLLNFLNYPIQYSRGKVNEADLLVIWLPEFSTFVSSGHLIRVGISIGFYRYCKNVEETHS